MRTHDPPEPRPLRVALIGLGRIARRHVEAISADPRHFELVGACDPSPGLDLEVPVFDDLDRLWAQTRPDLVAIASPSGLHAAHIERAARAGCHVLVEKPLALSSPEAERALSVCREAGVSLSVVHPLRHWPTLVWARELLRSGALGSIHTVDVRVCWTRPESYYAQAPWRADPQLDRGVLHNQANHYIDMLVWMFGTPDRVFAELGTRGWEMPVPNVASILCGWGLTQGTVRATLRTYPENLEASLLVLGERGTLELRGVACEQIGRAVWEGGALSEPERAALEAKTQAARARGHALVYERWLRAARDPSRPVADAASLGSLRLLDAVERSARTQTLVHLS